MFKVNTYKNYTNLRYQHFFYSNIPNRSGQIWRQYLGSVLFLLKRVHLVEGIGPENHLDLSPSIEQDFQWLATTSDRSFLRYHQLFVIKQQKTSCRKLLSNWAEWKTPIWNHSAEANILCEDLHNQHIPKAELNL